MQRFPTTVLTATLTTVGGLALPADAAPFAADNGLLIEYAAGGGDATGYLVLDLAATSGNSYAFSLDFDPTGPTLTGYDLIQQIADAGPLDFTATDFGNTGEPSNYFIDNVFYQGDQGDANQFFAQWEGFVVDNSSVDWQIGQGVSNVNLTDGLVVGLRNPFSFDDEPNAPFVPEPASLVVLGLGGMLLLRRSSLRV